ncbi:phospholipid/cholesterol/gamma-HCH transport system ATP-binding protein [Nannocystis exedens]|uniref:Phospholipid/cholesterol/gamma-HCH transport system ATP-binding protein n=1 Tax=Nannocystis exedens TaxID=54 RepID=A0A1I1TDD6_9BACT|nr:ATP-binding cassette domain-containing protein [Nannocystis exedens]PCC66634.1 ABC transporter ATP-binding protein [Nannocystis exedens]SFD56615.1 phospholipid/cholesterol/gamma-HCH transport system ATP-binding protein [Nannocystis exedens]
MAPIIELRNVYKRFGDNIIYEDMSFGVEAGETFTIIGGSGMGKSVCLKLMIGLLPYDAGHVLYRGKEVGDMNAEELRELRRNVAMVFQGGALFDSMSVLDNVTYALREHTKMSDQDMLERARECLDMVGLGYDKDILYRMPASLSGGMRKRAALARSIAIKPEVILYDEPTTGLDPANIERIGHMIRKLQKELGVTSIVVTHDMPIAWKCSNRVAMLWQRKFPHIGTPEEMQANPAPEVHEFINGIYHEDQD